MIVRHPGDQRAVARSPILSPTSIRFLVAAIAVAAFASHPSPPLSRLTVAAAPNPSLAKHRIVENDLLFNDDELQQHRFPLDDLEPDLAAAIFATQPNPLERTTAKPKDAAEILAESKVLNETEVELNITTTTLKPTETTTTPVTTSKSTTAAPTTTTTPTQPNTTSAATTTETTTKSATTTTKSPQSRIVSRDSAASTRVVGDASPSKDTGKPIDVSQRIAVVAGVSAAIAATNGRPIVANAATPLAEGDVVELSATASQSLATIRRERLRVRRVAGTPPTEYDLIVSDFDEDSPPNVLAIEEGIPRARNPNTVATAAPLPPFSTRVVGDARPRGDPNAPEGDVKEHRVRVPTHLIVEEGDETPASGTTLSPAAPPVPPARFGGAPVAAPLPTAAPTTTTTTAATTMAATTTAKTDEMEMEASGEEPPRIIAVPKTVLIPDAESPLDPEDPTLVVHATPKFTATTATTTTTATTATVAATTESDDSAEDRRHEDVAVEAVDTTAFFDESDEAESQPTTTRRTSKRPADPIARRFATDRGAEDRGAILVGTVASRESEDSEDLEATVVTRRRPAPRRILRDFETGILRRGAGRSRRFADSDLPSGWSRQRQRRDSAEAAIGDDFELGDGPTTTTRRPFRRPKAKVATVSGATAKERPATEAVTQKPTEKKTTAATNSPTTPLISTTEKLAEKSEEKTTFSTKPTSESVTSTPSPTTPSKQIATAARFSATGVVDSEDPFTTPVAVSSKPSSPATAAITTVKSSVTSGTVSPSKSLKSTAPVATSTLALTPQTSTMESATEFSTSAPIQTTAPSEIPSQRNLHFGEFQRRREDGREVLERSAISARPRLVPVTKSPTPSAFSELVAAEFRDISALSAAKSPTEPSVAGVDPKAVEPIVRPPQRFADSDSIQQPIPPPQPALLNPPAPAVIPTSANSFRIGNTRLIVHSIPFEQHIAQQPWGAFPQWPQ